MKRMSNGITVAMTEQEQSDFLASLPDGKTDERMTMDVTDLQFAAAAILPKFGFMTAQEAADWVGAGIIPAAAQAVIDQIQDPTEKAVATIRIRGARTISRNESFVSALAAYLGLTDDEVDAFFSVARSLF